MTDIPGQAKIKTRKGVVCMCVLVRGFTQVHQVPLFQFERALAVRSLISDIESQGNLALRP
jgi:hypothetical protein